MTKKKQPKNDVFFPEDGEFFILEDGCPKSVRINSVSQAEDINNASLVHLVKNPDLVLSWAESLTIEDVRSYDNLLAIKKVAKAFYKLAGEIPYD